MPITEASSESDLGTNRQIHDFNEMRVLRQVTLDTAAYLSRPTCLEHNGLYGDGVRVRRMSSGRIRRRS